MIFNCQITQEKLVSCLRVCLYFKRLYAIVTMVQKGLKHVSCM